MKTLLKTLAYGALLMAFAAVPAFAQADECETIYAQFTANYKGPDLAKKKIAVEAGEQLIAKCSTNEAYREPIVFVNKQLPKLKKDIGFGAAATTFENAIRDPKNVNADAAFSSGKEVIAADPNLTLDVALVLATLGFDKSAAATPVDTYNADAVNYAKTAIQKIEGGATSKDYGLLNFIYKTKEYPDGKSNALAWMNYTVGYIMYNRQNQKKEAIPYLYKAMQYTSAVKKNPVVYQTIGDWYKDEYNRIDDERTKIAAEAKTKATDEEKKPLIDKAKEMLLLQKGYADRMIDAYARAYSLAGTDQAYKTGLYNNLKVLYGFRFDGKTDGLDSYISTLTAKPMPDPMTTVTPVVETTTTATTTPTSSSTLTSTPTTTAVTTATTNKPTTTPTTATTTKAKTTTKAPVKTAPKKKGTR
jgi:cell division septation protein DedD